MSENEIIETIPSKNVPVKLGVTRQAIKKLQAKYSEVPDAKTPEGYRLIKLAKSELTPLRTGVEKERKLQVAAALAHQKRVNTEAKEVTQLIVDIETPLYEAKKLVDDEAERIRREAEEAEIRRIENIESAIADINNSVNGLLGADSGEIKNRLDSVKSEIDQKYFEEFYDSANQARSNAIEKLQVAYDDRLAYEKQAAKQAEREKKMAEQQAELDRKQAELEAAEAEQERAAREEQIRNEAAEKAKLEAEEKASSEIRAAEEREKLAKQEAAEAEARVRREAEEQKQSDEAAAQAREDDKNHRGKINTAAVEAMVEGGVSELAAKKIVTLIAKRKIPAITISY